MTNLDDKLREILRGYYLHPEEPIAQIKQAFADYDPQLMAATWNALGSVPGLMTGQEWEEKALREGWTKPPHKVIDDDD